MNRVIYAAAAAIVICLAMGAYSGAAEEDLKENVTRLHIIANSDSAADQAVKLKVRDAVLNDARENGVSRDAEHFADVADRVLKENGFTYSASAEFGIFPFPSKDYKSLSFPAGEYRGLRVVLGSGGGANWWCVMNPPLCFNEESGGGLSEKGRLELENALERETYELVTEKPEIRFKIVEIINGLRKNCGDNKRSVEKIGRGKKSVA